MPVQTNSGLQSVSIAKHTKNNVKEIRGGYMREGAQQSNTTQERNKESEEGNNEHD